MKYRLKRFQNIGAYFSKPKAFDSTIKELRDEAKNKQSLQRELVSRARGTNWAVRYKGINKYGDLVFETNSQTGTGTYTQHIRFYGLKDMNPTSKNEILDMIRNGDVGVSCDDPSFLYWGGAYNATQKGYNIFEENRGLNDPNKRTKENFVLCKHLIVVLQSLPFWWGTIIGDYRNYFKILEGSKTVEEVEKEDEEEVKEDFTEEEIEAADMIVNGRKEEKE